jgi:hypothetical protein
MTKGRVRAVSLVVGVVTAAGMLMVGWAVAADANPPESIDRQVAQRSAQLDRYEASLRKTLAQPTPQLPPVAATSTATQGTGASPRVVYRRAAPQVVGTVRGDDEHEYEGDEHEYDGDEHEFEDGEADD